jgi:TatD DNase family protein
VIDSPPLIDFHCHLSRSGGLPILNGPKQQPLSGAPQSARVLAVTNTPSEWAVLSRGVADPRVIWALGLHPGERHSSAAVAQFQSAVHRAAAVGEIGLDFRRTAPTPRSEQIRRLDEMLRLIDSVPKLLTLHSTGATRETVDVLSDHRTPGAILHWFLGKPSVIDKAIDLDLFFSVNPAMLRSTNGQNAVAEMPPNRVLLETDAPYGHGGKAGAVEIDAALTSAVRSVARLWQLPELEAREQIVVNQNAILERAMFRRWRSV